MSKRTIIIFGFALVSFLTTSMFYIFLNTKGIILKSDLVCDFKSDVYISDFIYKLDGKLTNDYKIDTRKVGSQSVRAVFRDKHGLYKVKSFEIEVRDVVGPTILVNNEYNVYVGDEKNILDNILCADDTDDNVKCEINGSYNLESVGRYPLNISASDKYGNKTSRDFVLNVIERVKNSDNNISDSFISYVDIYKKYRNKNTLIGLDLSKWQEEVDFKKLVDNKVEFVMLKIGGQQKINGKIVMDPYFKRNIEEASKYGIRVGIYFYSYANSTSDAIKQADWVIRNIRDYDIDMPISFDWENWEYYNKFNLSFNSLNNIASAFINRVYDKGYDGMLYSSEYYLSNIWFDDLYDNIWLANYGTVSYGGKYKMWQLCSDGRVDGINEDVDIDIYYNN